MADRETMPSNSVLEQLEEALGSPEPMCLALIHVDTDRATTADWAAVPEDGLSDDQAMLQAVQERLSGLLRRYDLMGRLGAEGFMVVFKTLADAQVLDSRLYVLYEKLSESYDIASCRVVVPVSMGAAVRWPAEDVNSLMRRADKALDAARRAGGKAPVLM